jgi:hypothetical protein
LGKLNNPQILMATIAKIERNANPKVFLTDSNLNQYLSQTSPEPHWKLTDRIFDRLKSVTTESLSELSPAQIEDIFNNKTIIIGERDTLINKPLIFVNSSALKKNRAAIDSNLNLLKIRSQPEQFIWTFVWCSLSISVVWQLEKRLFVSIFIAVVGSQIILGGVILITGNIVPLVTTSIAIISAGTIILTCRKKMSDNLLTWRIYSKNR